MRTKDYILMFVWLVYLGIPYAILPSVSDGLPERIVWPLAISSFLVMICTLFVLGSVSLYYVFLSLFCFVMSSICMKSNLHLALLMREAGIKMSAACGVTVIIDAVMFWNGWRKRIIHCKSVANEKQRPS